jgi:hypothetical protein
MSALDFRSGELQDDEDFRSASIWFDLRRGLFEPSEVRGTNVTLPSAPGRVWMPKVPDNRIIEIVGFVRGMGDDLEERQESWRTSTQALMALMQFDDVPGALVVSPPYLGLDQSYSINAVAINTMGGQIIGCMTFQSWSIQLESVDPEWVPGGCS